MTKKNKVVLDMSNNQINHKVPLSGRLSYGLTDGCGNLLYCIIGSYLLYFYTDVFGLSVGKKFRVI